MTITQKQSYPNQRRRVSYSSTLIMAGCMPEKVNLDNPTITIILTFDKPPTIDKILSNVETLFQFHRLSNVPKLDINKTWQFENTGKIDAKDMVRELTIFCDTEEDIADIIQEQKLFNLRREHLPWWEFVLITNKGKGDHLLLFRIDHSIADGLSLANVFPTILKHMDGSNVDSLIPDSMISSKKNAMSKVLTLLWKLPKALYDVFMSPTGRTDDLTVFSKNVVGEHMVDKRNQKLIIFKPIPLDFIKQIKDKARVSLNDVLLTIWSHAVHEYCNIRDCDIINNKKERILFRVMMTYGFAHKKNSDAAEAIRNQWVAIDVNLPIGVKSIGYKLKYINQMTTYLKSSPVAYVQQFLQNVVLPLFPLWLSRSIIFDVYSRRSMTCTNVPGPQEQVCIAGEAIKSCKFFVNHIHPVLSILSYNGEINITLTIDQEAVPDAHLLPSYVMKALCLLGHEFNIEVPSSVLQSAKMH